MYRIIIKRDGTNKLTGRAMYRVVTSWMQGVNDCRSIVDIFLGWYTEFPVNYGILSKKPYRAGCYINPAKVLMESGFIF